MRRLCVALGVGFIGFSLAAAAQANTPPVVSNVVAVQRPHTALIDVTYDVTDADGDALFITLWYSLDGGASWNNQCITVSGDVGEGVLSGVGRSATWDAGADAMDFIDGQFKLRVYADDGGVELWSEGFEGGCPAGWSLNPDWECGTPVIGPGAAYAGANCLGTVLIGNYNNSLSWPTATATSPAIDLTTAAAPVLTFRVWIDTEGSVYDGFNLKISTDGGATFAVITSVSPTYPLNIDSQPAWGGREAAAGWQSFTAGLGAYAGQTVLLQFAFRSDGSITYPGVYVDELVIQD